MKQVGDLEDTEHPRVFHVTRCSQCNGQLDLPSTSELERKRSERREDENSPSRPGEEPYDPVGETVAPGGVHDVQECPRNVETNALRQDTRSGGHAVELEASKVVEGDRDSAKVVGDAECDWIGPSNDCN